LSGLSGGFSLDSHGTDGVDECPVVPLVLVGAALGDALPVPRPPYVEAPSTPSVRSRAALNCTVEPSPPPFPTVATTEVTLRPVGSVFGGARPLG
jgi:hypothetical protein